MPVEAYPALLCCWHCHLCAIQSGQATFAVAQWLSVSFSKDWKVADVCV